MPVSLNLPFAVCWPIVRLMGGRRGRVRGGWTSQEIYFREQYAGSESFADWFMRDIDFKDQRVLDVGAGLGGRAPFFIDRGAKEVWCVDINRGELRVGEVILRAQFPQYAARVHFSHPEDLPSGTTADLAVLVDSFEHLMRPQEVLDQTAARLRSGGRLWVGSIGWYNHLASHCTWHIPVPWCQLFFSEMAILKSIRRLLHSPGYQPLYWEVAEGLDRWEAVKSLKDRPGEPLNQLSLRAIQAELRRSQFDVESFRLYPIRAGSAIGKLIRPLLSVPGLDELLHGYYTAVLRKP